jgi:hypothetical protein
MPRPELSRLSSQYPLAKEWSIPELFHQRFSIDRFHMECVGLVSSHANGMALTGSAASRETEKPPVTRAYFELVERTSVIEAELRDIDRFRQQTIAGEFHGWLEKFSLFPATEDPARWRFAKSNGVAAQLSWEMACRSAALELMERDRILRSWFGEIRPEKITAADPHGGPSPLLHPDLNPYYDFENYRIGPPVKVEGLGEVTVVAVFGFPRRANVPRVAGFAARPSPGEAVFSATAECLQILSFLWGEAIPEVLPLLSPSPDYHQEVFLLPEGISRIRRWLSGEHQGYATSPPPSQSFQIHFSDITPPQLVSRLFVVKAHCPTLLPLTFGSCRKFAPPGFPEELLVHPIT